MFIEDYPAPWSIFPADVIRRLLRGKMRFYFDHLTVSGRPTSAALRLAARLLPGPDRERWLEEWRGELYDLRADGISRWRRATHLIDLVRGAVRQAFILRRRGRVTE